MCVLGLGRPVLLLMAMSHASYSLAQSWNTPTCTQTVTYAGPSQGGRPPLFVINKYSDWKWVDPAGVTHTFPGTSATKYYNGAHYGIASAGPNPVVTDLGKVQASDGSPVFLSTVNGGTGVVKVKGSIYPKYKVLSVIYAPPGNGSTVNYSTGSGWGTVSTIGHSFSNAIDLTAQIGNSGMPWAGSIGMGWSETIANEKSISITNSSAANSQFSNSTDGIDHNQDIIEIWLNPAIDLTHSSSAQASWTLTNNPGDPNNAVVGANVVSLTVAQLMGRAPIDNPYLIAQFKRDWPGGGPLTGPGTDTDFHNIAQQDPYYALGIDFSANTFTPDPARFTLAKCPKIHYEPSGSVMQSSGYVTQS